MKKRWLALLLVFVMVLSLAACGKADDGGGMENEEAEEVEEIDNSVISAHGVIKVTPLDGYTVTVSESQETLTIAPEDAENQSHDHIEIIGPDDTGTLFCETFGYVPGEEYTIDALKADIDADIEARPNVFSNPTEVTLGAYDYIRMNVVINAQDSYYYITLVDGVPHAIKVVGGDLLDIDSDDVTTMLESIEFGKYIEETEETEEEEVEEVEAEEKGKIYDGYYSFDVPEGFTLMDEKYQEKFVCSDDREISFLIKRGTVAEEVEFELGRGQGYEDMGEVTYGDYTWRALTFTWDDLPSVELVMDLEDGEHYINITMFCIAIDSDIAKQVMESLELEDNPYEAFSEYRDEVNSVD